MTLLQALQASPAFLVLSTALLGLLVGSFLNVVIYRLPVMMERAWRHDCAGLDEDQVVDSALTEEEPFNLVVPRSRCPHCGHLIRAHENIPVISYLLLRGRCGQCRAPISLRYPLIEFFTALVSVCTVIHFGATTQALFALLFSWSLIALTMIDIDHQLLPDSITLPLLWLGLLLTPAAIFTDSHSAIIGAAAGYLMLWLVYQLFKLVTGKEGMGYGDFKLLAVLGGWMGWQILPLVLLLSSLVGAVIGTLILTFSKQDRATPIPFGPYLAVAGWIALLWGSELNQLYLNFAGLS